MSLNSTIFAATLLTATAPFMGGATAAPLSASLGARVALPDAAVVETVQLRNRTVRGNIMRSPSRGVVNRGAMVQNRGGNWRSQAYRGRGIGPGIAAGVVVGGALAAGAYGYYEPYGYGYGAGYDEGYAVVSPGYGQVYTNAPGYDGDAIAYCQQQFRSYDVRSQSYLGFDGVRHSCP